MAYPIIYDPEYSYTGFQQAQQGISAFPGAQMDNDFAGLHDSVSNLALFVSGALRSDGALSNGIVTYDSLSPALQTGGIRPAYPWATGTAYAVGSTVIHGGNLYRALLAHTSGVFAVDLAFGDWVFIVAIANGFNILDYGAVADSTTDNKPLIQAAVDAAYAFSQSGGLAAITLSTSGTVIVPAGSGCFRIASPIDMKQGISLVGVGGMASCILADNCDALHYAFDAYFGQPQIIGVFLQGINPTAPRIAVKRSESPNNVGNVGLNRMLGLCMQNSVVWGFDTVFDVLTLGNLWVTNCQFQNVNDAFKIRGASFGIRLSGVQITYGVGDGLGSRGDAIVAIAHTYTTPAQTLGPEGIEIDQCQCFDVNNGARLDIGNFFTLTNSDIQAVTSGVRFKSWGKGLNVHNNYILVTGASAQAAIFGEGAASNPTQIVDIVDNVFESIGAGANNNGIQINEPGLFGVHNVNLVRNDFTGFTGRDIYVYGPNKVLVENNTAYSTGTVNSIEFTSAVGFINFVARNKTANAIVVNAADLVTGAVRKRDNLVAAVREPGTWDVTTDSLPLNRVPIGGGAGAQPTAAAAGTNGQVFVGFTGGAPLFVTMSGEASINNTGVMTLANAAVIAKVLTGFASGAGTVAAADSILAAFQKIDGNVALKAPLASPVFTGSVTAPIHAAPGAMTIQVNGSTVAGSIDTAGHWSLGTQLPLASNTPLLDLNISGTAVANPSAGATILRAVNSGTGAEIALQSYGAGGNTYSAYMAGGTAAVPAALTSGTIIGVLLGKSFDGAAWGNAGASNVLVSMRAAQLQAVGAHGTEIALATTPNGTTARADAVVVQNSGALTVGAAAIAADPGIGSASVSGFYASKAPVTTASGTSSTVGAQDADYIVNASGTYTLTLPGAGVVGTTNNTGRELHLKVITAQIVNSASSNVVPLAGGAAGTAILTAAAGKWARLKSDGTNWIIMAAN